MELRPNMGGTGARNSGTPLSPPCKAASCTLLEVTSLELQADIVSFGALLHACDGGSCWDVALRARAATLKRGCPCTWVCVPVCSPCVGAGGSSNGGAGVGEGTPPPILDGAVAGFITNSFGCLLFVGWYNTNCQSKMTAAELRLQLGH